ncbi:hypothetical protein FJY69_01745 [candidate division WOR-3 bacterium]|nr:hypothetical protein [candidate division WOR-3 bacterium]
MKRTLVIVLVAIISLTAALSPTGAEPGLDHGRFLLNTGFVSSLAFPNQNSSVAAFNGTCILAVWVDRRGGESDIYGCRVTPDGVLLDSVGIAIPTAPRTQWYPAVCSDGTDFLVAWWWWDESGGASRIYASRETSAGTVLDTAGIRVSPAASGQSMPAIAFDGADYLVTWVDDRNGSRDIYGARVSPAGVVGDAALVVGGDGAQQSAALCRGSGDQVLLVFGDLARTVGGRTYNSRRVWGRRGFFPGVQDERPIAQSRPPMPGPTIVRGVLVLPRDMTELPGNSDRVPRPALLDAASRKVMDLHAGDNDVSGLAPGVYFVRLTVHRTRCTSARWS